ncbi:MAG: hypothetical protein R3C28_31675 [Pirellulaceae bacterium]
MLSEVTGCPPNEFLTCHSNVRRNLGTKFSPDGKWLGGGTRDGSVLVWNVASRKIAFTTPPKEELQQGFRGSGSYVADYFAFAPDGQHLVIAGSWTIEIWDVQRQETVKTWTNPEARDPAHLNYSRYTALCFTRDGRYLVGARFGGGLFVWDWQGANTSFEPRSTAEYGTRSFDVTADGMLAVAGSRAGYRLYTLPDLDVVSASEDSPHGGIDVDPSPDGSRLAFCVNDVSIFNLKTQTMEARLPHSTYVEHVAWHPDGTRIAASDTYATTKLWDVETRKVLATFRGSISTFSPDGTILAVGSQGSQFIGDTRKIGRVTLHHAPTLNEIDRP